MVIIAPMAKKIITDRFDFEKKFSKSKLSDNLSQAKKRSTYNAMERILIHRLKLKILFPLNPSVTVLLIMSFIDNLNCFKNTKKNERIWSFFYSKRFKFC